MRVFISADIEGIWGVVSRKQTGGDSSDYTRGRELMTKEVNLACEALLENGAAEIVVNDSHGNMDNILIEKLHPEVQLISGSPKPLGMMQGIEKGYDKAFFIGYHSRAGTARAAFDHTYHGRLFFSLKLNGKPLGEAGFNTLLAGYYSVPVVFLSGDKTSTEQAQDEVGEIVTLAVKDSINRTSAHNLSFNHLKQGYKDKIREAYNLSKEPIEPKGPFTMEVEFFTSMGPNLAERIPAVTQTGARTVEVKSNDFLELYKIFEVLFDAAG